MKRRPQLVTVILCAVFFLGAACWYWLSEEDASIESPAVSPALEAPPAGSSNVAANLFWKPDGASDDFALAHRTIYF
jgi:hypothetical protein